MIIGIFFCHTRKTSVLTSEKRCTSCPKWREGGGGGGNLGNARKKTFFFFRRCSLLLEQKPNTCQRAKETLQASKLRYVAPKPTNRCTFKLYFKKCSYSKSAIIKYTPVKIGPEFFLSSFYCLSIIEFQSLKQHN